MSKLSYVDKEKHTVDEWRENFNRVKENLSKLISSQGDISTLTPRDIDEDTGEVIVPDSISSAFSMADIKNKEDFSDVVDAVQHQDFNLADFGTAVGFINHTNTDFKKVVGDLEKLTTEEKQTITGALNWVVHQLDVTATSGVDIGAESFVGLINKLSAKIGNVPLNDADVAAIVTAINLIIAKFGGLGNVLDLSTLATPVKTNFIASINSLMDLIKIAYDNRDNVRVSFDGFDDDSSKTLVEKLNKAIATLGNSTVLRTEAKDILVPSLNELHDEIGDPQTLNTLKKDTIVEGINDRYEGAFRWVGNNPARNQIFFREDIHILNSGTVLMMEEEYDFWEKSGRTESYNVWVKSSEVRKYKSWVSSGYNKTWYVSKPSGYYTTRTIRVPTYSWTKQRTVIKWNYHHHNVYDPGKGHKHYRHVACLTPSEFIGWRNKIWNIHLRNGWTGPTGWGGRGWGNHKYHRIFFHRWNACHSVDRSVRTVTYKNVTKQVWVDTTTRVKHSKWIDTSKWVDKTKVVDTSHWETRKRWVDTSKWVKKTRTVPYPDTPNEGGVYVDGNTKAAGFKGYLEGSVVGDVQGTVTGNASGISNNWKTPRMLNLAVQSGGNGIDGNWVFDGTSNKSLNISGQLPYSKQVHNHDHLYLGLNDSRQVFKAVTTSSSNINIAWSQIVAIAGQTVVDSWEVGQVVVLKASDSSFTYLKSDGGWMLLSTSNVHYTVV